MYNSSFAALRQKDLPDVPFSSSAPCSNQLGCGRSDTQAASLAGRHTMLPKQQVVVVVAALVLVLALVNPVVSGRSLLDTNGESLPELWLAVKRKRCESAARSDQACFPALDCAQLLALLFFTCFYDKPVGRILRPCV